VILASQAVALVRDQVTDRPSRVAAQAAAALQSTSTTTTLPRYSTTTTTTGAESTTTSTTSGTPATATSTTLQTPTTTTTRDELFDLEGGWVKVACDGDRIVFKSAAPQAGFQFVQREIGEEQVNIDFESEDHTSTFQASCENGQVKESINEYDGHENHGGDDD